MYKLTMFFFLLTAFSSQGLMDSYKITFNNEDATYTLEIDNGSLVFENNQPNVTVTAIGNDATDTDKNTVGKIYKITKGATWQEGLKIDKEDVIDTEKIGGEDVIDALREMNALLFGEKEHQAYEIILSYPVITIIEQSSNLKTVFPIGNSGLFISLNVNKQATISNW